MPSIPKTVFVSASFEQGQGLFNWLKKYGTHSDDRHIYFGDFAFTSFNPETCDAVLILNTPSEPINIQCDPNKVIAFMMEPGIRHQHPFMFKELDQYARVYSPLPNSNNTIISHGYLGWYLSQDLHTLQQLAPPVKTRPISCISSGLKQLKGHRLRLGFIEILKQQLPQIDYYGKGSNYLPEKMDGLLPYRYSISIENTAMPFYFTEKINDCFLAWTVPFYYGCRNIGRFFPEKSFIKIDILDPVQAVRAIRNIIDNDDWEKRLGAIEEARNLVLEKYQPLAGAAHIFSNIADSSRQKVSLQPVKQALNEKIISIFQKLVNQ